MDIGLSGRSWPWNRCLFWIELHRGEDAMIIIPSFFCQSYSQHWLFVWTFLISPETSLLLKNKSILAIQIPVQGLSDMYRLRPQLWKTIASSTKTLTTGNKGTLVYVWMFFFIYFWLSWDIMRLCLQVMDNNKLQRVLLKILQILWTVYPHKERTLFCKILNIYYRQWN